MRMNLPIVLSLALVAMLTEAVVSQDIVAVRAADVLPKSLLQGPGFVVNETVVIKDNRYLFQVKTDYGDFSALGLPMLELRLREILW